MKKKTTSRDVAKMAGVSQTTVSLILNNRRHIAIPESTRARVIAVAREMNYIPNQFAQGLKTNRSRLIGLMLPTISNPFYQMLAQHIEEYAADVGYNILLCNTCRQTDREESYIALLKSKSADGIIYAFTPRLPEKAMEVYMSRTVVIGEQESDSAIRTISLDSFKAGDMIARYLIELGHRKIGFITTPLSGISHSRKLRLSGIQAGMHACGLENGLIIKEATFEREMNDGSLEIDMGYTLTDELLKQEKVTAIVGVNDMVAFGAVNYLTRLGLRVPEDVSVCGFDNIYLSHTLNPHITTIEHYIADKARMAVDYIIRGMDDETAATVDGEHKPQTQVEHNGPILIARSSTGPAPI